MGVDEFEDFPVLTLASRGSEAGGTESRVLSVCSEVLFGMRRLLDAGFRCFPAGERASASKSRSVLGSVTVLLTRCGEEYFSRSFACRRFSSSIFDRIAVLAMA